MTSSPSNAREMSGFASAKSATKTQVRSTGTNQSTMAPRGEEATAGSDADATAAPERFASLDARQRRRLAALLERRARTPSE